MRIKAIERVESRMVHFLGKAFALEANLRDGASEWKYA
jgi:hypothetical protein